METVDLDNWRMAQRIYLWVALQQMIKWLDQQDLKQRLAR
jgi:hypothetical protein